MPKKNDVDLNFAIGLPPEKAIEYFKAKGYTFSWDWTDVWKEAHAKAFTVAKVMRMDILQDIRGMVQKSLDEGITFQQFKKELEPTLKAKGWWGKVLVGDGKGGKVVQLGSPWRLKTIYRTNLQTALMAGRYKGMMEVAAVRPYWQYIAVLDSRTRPWHRALNGQVFRFDDPFWNINYPPNGFGCRCRVRSLSEKNMQDRGLKVSPSNSAPNVADVGWDYNPGKAAFQPDLKKYDGDIAKWYKSLKYKPADKNPQVKIDVPPQPVATAKPEGLAQKIKVKTYNDVDTIMKSYADENPEIFRKGYKGLKYDNNSYFMATDCQGTIYISKRNFASRNFAPGKDLKNAMTKMGKGAALTFQEEYSLESLWHEVMHNRVKNYAALRKGTANQIAMETLNQFVSRHTYPEFIKKMGGEAIHQQDILEKGFGYGNYVANFRALLSKAGINEIKELSMFQDILLDDYAAIHGKLSSHISNVSGKELQKIEEAISNLCLDSKRYETKLIDLGI